MSAIATSSSAFLFLSKLYIAVHLVNKDTIAAGLFDTFGNRLHPPIAEIGVQQIETESAIVFSQLARFGIGDQELLELGISIDSLFGEILVVRGIGPSKGRIKVEQNLHISD